MAHKYHFDPKFYWWTKDHLSNYKWLAECYAGKPNLRFLEIGTFEGRTAVWFLDNVLTGKNCKLTCIDPDPTENMVHNFKPHKDRVSVYRFFSEQILPGMLAEDRRFDLIYIDGDHNAKGVLQDIVMSWRLLKDGGILLMDDYEMEATDPWHYISHKEFAQFPRANFTHPRVAIDAFLNIYRGLYEPVINNFQVGVRKITDLEGKNLGHGKDQKEFSYIAK
jgi:ubiquinone/menaquinone biosynthesis C-methylase UbiE